MTQFWLQVRFLYNHFEYSLPVKDLVLAGFSSLGAVVCSVCQTKGWEHVPAALVTFLLPLSELLCGESCASFFVEGPALCVFASYASYPGTTLLRLKPAGVMEPDPRLLHRLWGLEADCILHSFSSSLQGSWLKLPALHFCSVVLMKCNLLNQSIYCWHGGFITQLNYCCVNNLYLYCLD